MKWRHESLTISDANDLFKACNVILSYPVAFPELEEALDFCRKLVEEYRVWLACDKEAGFPIKFRQQIASPILWTITLKKKVSFVTESTSKEGEQS